MPGAREDDQTGALKRRLLTVEADLDQLRRENEILREICRRSGVQVRGGAPKKTEVIMGIRDLLNPRLTLLFRIDASEKLSGYHSPARALAWEKSGDLSWVFLGIGHDGDMMGLALWKLGRRKFRIVYESLVPGSRIRSPLSHVMRFEDDGGAEDLADILARRSDELQPLLRRQNGGVASDLFIASSMSQFGIDNDVAQRLCRLVDGLRAGGDDLSQCRLHGLFFKDADSPTPHQQRSFLGLLESGALSSCLVVDPNRVASFGAASDGFRQVAATVAGHLDSFRRAANSEPLAGCFEEAQLRSLLAVRGFSVQGAAATFEASRVLETLKAGLSEGLFWPVADHLNFREAAVVLIVGREWLEEEPELLAIIQKGWATLRQDSPQVSWHFALFVDGRRSIRVLTWLAGFEAF